MAKVSPLQDDFSGGEISTLLHGRVSSERYKISVKTCLNYIPTVQGPLVRRSGTRYVSGTKDNGYARLQSFEFSTTQAYMLEFGDEYVRFYKNNENITLPDKVITNITQANPAVVTSNSHGYSNGDRILIFDVLGMTEVNNREFEVAGVTANTFELLGINSTGFTAYSSGGVAAEIYEIESQYTAADLDQLSFTQSADVLYIVHPNYPLTKLLRHGHTDWEFQIPFLLDGPYGSENETNISLTPGAATGSGVTLTATPTVSVTNAANNGAGLIRITMATTQYVPNGGKVYVAGIVGTTEANGTWTIDRISDTTIDLRGSTFANAYVSGGTVNPALFESTDAGDRGEGKLIRIKEGSTWGWVTIVTFVNSSQVTVDIIETLTNTNAKLQWRMGLYSYANGWPSTITFHEDRLMLAGSLNAPQRIDGSRTGDYENFAPTELDGTVSPDNALSFSFNSNDVNAVQWMTSDEKGLLAGTVNAEWVTRPSNQGEGLTPSNITAKKFTTWGSEDITPVQAGKATLFIQRAGRKLREISYYFDVDGYRSADLTQLAEHILPTGAIQMAYQKEPQQLVWVARSDGTLISLTYDRDVSSLRAGWARHILGGVSDAAGSQSIVESVQVSPSADGKRQDVWLIVKRYINGNVVRYIEYITKIFESVDEQRDAFFVDAGLTYDNPITITNITKANPGVVTANAHGFSNGNKVLITGVLGMTNVNTNTYLVANKTPNTFELHDLNNVAVNTTSYSTYVSGGQVRKLITTVSGLSHLEGQSLSVLGNGAVQPNVTVTNGKVTITEPASTIHLGLAYMSDGELLRFENGAQDGTALGKTRRTHRVGIYLFRTLGFKIGFGFDDLSVIPFRTTKDLLTRAPALFSGILSENTSSDYNFENNFCFRQDQPLPGTILAIMPQMVTQDRG